MNIINNNWQIKNILTKQLNEKKEKK